jgi:autotransporter passenger strand-loop-strand repeat protein
MTTITAPPDRDGLVLGERDLLVVENQGSASHTVLNAGGRLDILNGGSSDHTTVNSLGIEHVERGGVSNSPRIMGGREFVESHGAVNDATIGDSGQLELFRGGHADNVTFADQGRNSVLLDNPANLHGTITNWRVGDYVDLIETRNVSVSESGGVLTVNYDVRGEQRQATYTLADQQADTHFVLRPDGHGGTDIMLAAGVQPHHQHDFLF